MEPIPTPPNPFVNDTSTLVLPSFEQWFFLPGDSLLFTAGLFVANGAIGAPLWAVCLLPVAAAFVGNVCGYYIGRAAGPAIFDKPRSRLFNPAYLEGKSLPVPGWLSRPAPPLPSVFNAT